MIEKLGDLDYFTIGAEFASLFNPPPSSWLGTLQFHTRGQILGGECPDSHRKLLGGIWQRKTHIFSYCGDHLLSPFPFHHILKVFLALCVLQTSCHWE